MTPTLLQRSLVLALLSSCWLAAPAAAQEPTDPAGLNQSGDVFGGINFGGLGDQQQDPVRWDATYTRDGGRGQLQIEATLGRSWHIYSTTQPAGGPLPTKFSIAAPETVSISGAAVPDEPPTQSVSDVYPGVTIEEHSERVLWTVPIKIPADFAGPIQVDVKALACQASGSCMPANETLTARLDQSSAKPTTQTGGQATDRQAMGGAAESRDPEALLAAESARTAEFQDDGYEVTWTAGVSESIAAGGRGWLVFRAEPEAEYHVYQSAVDDSESSTNFVVTGKDGLSVGAPETDKEVVSQSLLPSIPGLPESPQVKYYRGAVTWALPIEVPKGTAAGEYKLEGYVGYQACTDKSCLQPKALQFTASVAVSDSTPSQLRPIEMTVAAYATAIDAAASTEWVDPIGTQPAGEATDSEADQAAEEESAREPDAAQIANEPTAERDSTTDSAAIAGDPAPSETAADPTPASSRASLPLILLMALGGGLILNLMPCVLPVVGLKIMSFVQQAGEDRRRVFVLNFAYVAGILAVFAGLTALAVFASFGWGQQFTYFPVRLGLIVLIFALALSYLGVWELPTPGVGTGETSQELQSREGFTGAFFKGAFATILATPCSGPLLGVVLGYTITLQPIETAAVMMTVGIGMALPYILLGLFPRLIGFLPKPGNWMVTLKEFLAFLFLGTVAFFFNQFSDADKLPVFVTLIGVWFGCWIIGKVPPWEALHKRVRGWTVGVVSAILIGWFSFNYLSENEANGVAQANPGGEYIVDNHLRWEKYSEERLRELQAQGKTVMLDFTAAWCTNCFVNKKVALDTKPTSRLLQQLDGVAMLADWTDQNTEIESKLRELDSKSIPVLAIYPGKSPKDPIVLRDLVSQASVLSALERAGPSVDPSRVDRSNVAGEGASDGGQSRRYTSTPANSAGGRGSADSGSL